MPLQQFFVSMMLESPVRTMAGCMKGPQTTVLVTFLNIRLLPILPIPDWTSSGVWRGYAPCRMSAIKKHHSSYPGESTKEDTVHRTIVDRHGSKLQIVDGLVQGGLARLGRARIDDQRRGERAPAAGVGIRHGGRQERVGRGGRVQRNLAENGAEGLVLRDEVVLHN